MKLPIGGRVAIDRRKLLDLIDQMRVAAPMELREAQELLTQKEELLLKAREESQLLIAQAQQEVESRLTDNELIKAAEAKAAQQMEEADRYALEMLHKLESQLAAFLGSVRAGIDSMEEKASERVR